VLQATILRLGDVEVRPEEALEVSVKTSKCTALSRPKAWKKFALREEEGEEGEDETAIDQDDERRREEAIFAPLRMRTEYYIDRREGREEDEEDEEDNGSDGPDDDGDYTMKNGKSAMLEKVDDGQRVRGYKYGSTYVPCPDDDFPRLKTTKGIDICGFFQAKNVRLLPGRVFFI
jgi:ATP-dependent DNA helicase 2 subunit 2